MISEINWLVLRAWKCKVEAGCTTAPDPKQIDASRGAARMLWIRHSCQNTAGLCTITQAWSGPWRRVGSHLGDSCVIRGNDYLPLGCHSPEGRRKEASLWSSVLKHEEIGRVVGGKKSKAGLGKEETKDRIEDCWKTELGYHGPHCTFCLREGWGGWQVPPAFLCAHIFPRSSPPNPSLSSVILSLVLVLSQAVNETLISTDWK